MSKHIIMPQAISSLGQRNFRIFWLGQVISTVGIWMQSTAQCWLVLTMTNSPFFVGLVTSIQFLPMLLFSLLAGEIADRIPKKRLLYLTQSTMMVLALILGVLTLTGTIRYWHILILATLHGIANAFDNPTRQSFIAELVDKNNLMNAIVLNSTAIQAARLIGPALTGLAIGRLGMPSAFLFNGASFLPVLFSLLLIRKITPQCIDSTGKKQTLDRIREGLRYIRQSSLMLSTILLSGLISALAYNFNVLTSALAKNNLGQGAEGYGFLVSSMGIGALTGSIVMAMLSHRGPRRFLFYGSAAGMCVFQFLVAFTDNFYLAMFLLGLTGWMAVTFTISTNTRMQMEAPDHLRGRIMSVYSLIFLGAAVPAPIFAGFLANLWGAPVAFIIDAVSGLASTVAVFTWETAKMRKENATPVVGTVN